jgi:hypothetical protein
VRLFWKRRWFVTSSRIPFLYIILCVLWWCCVR